MVIVLILLFQGLPGGAEGHHCALQTSCGDRGPAIQFPFWLKDDKSSAHCGYGPSFGLSCTRKNETMLELPFSVKVSVSKIDYKLQEITVNNPNKCYPSLNLSLSPFQFSKRLVNDYSLFRCPSTPLSYLGEQVSCLSNPGHHVYAVPSNASIKHWPLLSCLKMYNIPSVPTGIFEQGYSVLSWSEPNCSECYLHQGSYCSFTTTPTERHQTSCSVIISDGISKFGVVEYAIGGVVLLAIVIPICIHHILDLLEKGDEVKIERFLEDYRALKPTRYTYAEIKTITHKFKDKLGQGGYGTVYKGRLSDDVYIAAKILNNFTGDGDDFINEVGTIGTIHHINVVRLVGYCADGYKKALVYEYLSNDSLEKFISSDRKKESLGWEKLQDIALGIAKGIEYLHQGCDQRILHFDIKPHNILLDKNFIPKISDFGLAKLCSKEQSVVSMTAARGTVGYIAPEVFSRNFGNVSHKSDVYSFGMLLLEMVGGRKKNIDLHTEENTDEVYFPEWIYKRLNRDEENKNNVEQNDDAKIVKKLTVVGLWCIQWYPGDRPSMKVVVQMLEGDVETLTMPSNPFSTADPSVARGNVGRRPFSSTLDIISESD